MVVRERVARDVSIRQAAAQLGVDESTLQYHLARPADAADGRRVWAVLQHFGDARVDPQGTTRVASRVVYDVLVREHAFRAAIRPSGGTCTGGGAQRRSRRCAGWRRRRGCRQT